jgi:NAD(P)-dependent dehydrogenase (short-subunit alcohol dehydrogenase family)
MSEVALVTGAGRGIGLEACRQLAERGQQVLATTRVAVSAELEQLVHASSGRIRHVTMDVSDDDSVAAAAHELGGIVEHLDLLLNNAGVYPEDGGGLERLDLDELKRAFDVNALGALRVTRAFLPLLRRGTGKRVVQVTSLMGSMADNTSGGSYAYRVSKSALNMVTRNLAHELGREGFVCLSVHPGWVQSRMGGAAAPLELSTAVEQVLENALSGDRADNGAFKGPGRADLPW